MYVTSYENEFCMWIFWNVIRNHSLSWKPDRQITLHLWNAILWITPQMYMYTGRYVNDAAHVAAVWMHTLIHVMLHVWIRLDLQQAVSHHLGMDCFPKAIHPVMFYSLKYVSAKVGCYSRKWFTSSNTPPNILTSCVKKCELTVHTGLKSV